MDWRTSLGLVVVSLIVAGGLFAVLRRVKALDPRVRIVLVVLSFAGAILIFGNAIRPTPPKSMRDPAIRSSLAASADRMLKDGFSRETRESVIRELTSIIGAHSSQMSRSQYDALIQAREELTRSFDSMPERELTGHVYDARKIIGEAAETF